MGRLLAIFTSVACAVLLVGCGGGTSTAAEEGAAVAGLSPQPPMDVSSVVLPDVSVRSAGVPFTMRAEPGHLLLVFFGYTSCPDVCPTTMAGIHAALTKLGDDAGRVDVAFVTVDPKRDTPKVLNTYLAHFVTDAHALRTTDASALRAAERPFGAGSTVSVEKGKYTVSHTSTLYAVSDAGAVVALWSFGVTVDTLARDLTTLLQGGTLA